LTASKALSIIGEYDPATAGAIASVQEEEMAERRHNMARLTIDDLQKIKEKHKAEFQLREGGYRAKVTVHMGHVA